MHITAGTPLLGYEGVAAWSVAGRGAGRVDEPAGAALGEAGALESLRNCGHETCIL